MQHGLLLIHDCRVPVAGRCGMSWRHYKLGVVSLLCSIYTHKVPTHIYQDQRSYRLRQDETTP